MVSNHLLVENSMKKIALTLAAFGIVCGPQTEGDLIRRRLLRSAEPDAD